ncbi:MULTISPECIES: DHH family phosphoesterase [Pseudothermotoga]|uniref:Uncharacterized protein n=1 Tax=Pseudothermotoga lettingae (strain ATCC BAA-301 / DSM 14385 / NBRC 107922 / TMO) TaxID=416591 RepID=A8F752_PSELT|nr:MULTISPECIES: hypothetical protein [Pseudothermotoga]ABV33986.1 hypothetical protein Tlet_1430 [Pseudothermotoga lettingae TMO]GLI49075.1 hypothetical protein PLETTINGATMO_12440 [Pseudothermotoga lettingae TMO]
MHTTHLNADADGFASVYWGYRIIGGYLFVHQPDVTVLNLMRKLKVENSIFPEKIHAFYIYDTSEPEKIPFRVYNYAVFDHHANPDSQFLKKAFMKYVRIRTANVMNLYDLSDGIDLEEDILFAFAVALVTDTGFLKAAKGEELEYLAKFLCDRPLDEVFEVVLSGKVKDYQKFIKHISNIEIVKDKLTLAIAECDDDDEFLCVVDLLMYPLNLSVVIGRLPWGSWVYCRKPLVQRVYQTLLREFHNRDAGRLYGFYDVDFLVKKLLTEF